MGKKYLDFNDEITVRLVELENADEPIETSVFDSSKTMNKMNENIEKEIAHLKLQIEEHSRDSVFPPPKGNICSFCGKDVSEAERIIAGSGDNNVCNDRLLCS